MNLCRTIFGVAAGVALFVAGWTQRAEAQHIADLYSISVQNSLYQPQLGQGVIIPRNQFIDVYSGVVNPDDGVAGPIPIGYRFGFDNGIFDQIYVGINGYLTFSGPYIGFAELLFSANNGPNLTIAPYWGDHYLRTPGYDDTDPSGRKFTPSYIRYVQKAGGPDPNDPTKRLPDQFIVEWENLNINYFFDPTDPDNPFSPNRQPQAPSIASFQAHLIEAPPDTSSRRGDIEFHYGPAGSNSGVSIVKFSGASVGIESDVIVPNGGTTWMNAVSWLESGGDDDSLRESTRLTSNWPPTGYPGRIFRFDGNYGFGFPDWGDGDANLTQGDANVPQDIRDDQRRFVTFADVIRILRHTASRNQASTNTGLVDFDSVFGRHGFHGDVNHNGRFYYSSSKANNAGDSLDAFGRIVRYKVLFPTKDVNPMLPFPQDNTFNGFLFDADEFDASLIMLYLAAKLPVLPWLPDTLPPFTGKVAPAMANNIQLGAFQSVTGKVVEIPIYFNGNLNGAQAVAIDAAPGTKILDVKPATKTDEAWVEAFNVENRLALAAAGRFQQGDVIATLIVEANDNGEVVFSNVRVGEQDKGMTKLSIHGNAVVGESLDLSQNSPNPFTVNSKTTIRYSVPTDGVVAVRVFDVLGREVRTLVNTDLTIGVYSTEWDGLDAFGKPVESGVYYYQINAGGQTRAMSMQVRK